MIRGYTDADVNKVDIRVIKNINGVMSKNWVLLSISNDGVNRVAVNRGSEDNVDIEFIPFIDRRIPEIMMLNRVDAVKSMEQISHHVNLSRLSDESYQDVIPYISMHEILLCVNVETGYAIDTCGKTFKLEYENETV